MVILGRTRCRDQKSILMFQSHFLMMLKRLLPQHCCLDSWTLVLQLVVHAEDPKKATSSLWWSSALGHSSRIWYLSKVNISSPQDDIWNSIFGNRLKFESQYLATAEFHILDSIFGRRLTFDVNSFMWSQTCPSSHGSGWRSKPWESATNELINSSNVTFMSYHHVVKFQS